MRSFARSTGNPNCSASGLFLPPSALAHLHTLRFKAVTIDDTFLPTSSGSRRTLHRAAALELRYATTVNDHR